MEKPRFDFSKVLSVRDQHELSNPEGWRWVSSCGLAPKQRSARHPAHERWMKVPGNTHRPAHREVMLTLRGKAVYSKGGRCYLRQPGTVILLDRHEERDLKGSPDKLGFSSLWLHLYHDDYLTFLINSCDVAGHYVHEVPLQVKSGSAARHILMAWDQCLADPQNLLCRALLKSLIISTALEVLGGAVSGSPSDPHASVVDSVKRYIEIHLGEDLSLQNLASLAGYSPFFFHRIFLKHTGKTPVQFITAARLARALELLDQGFRVDAVAESVGFSSVSYFHHLFRKNFGQTPSARRSGGKSSSTGRHAAERIARPPAISGERFPKIMK